jgi:hypothetical protein
MTQLRTHEVLYTICAIPITDYV